MIGFQIKERLGNKDVKDIMSKSSRSNSLPAIAVYGVDMQTSISFDEFFIKQCDSSEKHHSGYWRSNLRKKLHNWKERVGWLRRRSGPELDRPELDNVIYDFHLSRYRTSLASSAAKFQVHLRICMLMTL